MNATNAERRRAVFLDKDGTLIEDVPYNVDPDRIRLARGADSAARALKAAGYLLFVVSNQSGVARGLFPYSALAAVQSQVEKLMTAIGAPLDGFYVCPHWPDGAVREYAIRCDCRKPAPGLILRAAADHSVDLTQSWMIGDKLDDALAGMRAGCRTILLQRRSDSRATEPGITAVVPTLIDAAHFVLHAPSESRDARSARQT